MSILTHPAPERVKVAAVMAGAIALGVVAGTWYVVRDHLDRVVEHWTAIR